MTLTELQKSRGQGVRQSIPIISTVAANSSETYVSTLISRPFILYQVRFLFTLNQNYLVKLYPFVAPDNDLSTTLPLTGFNLLSLNSETPYAAGDDNSKDFFLDYLNPNGGSYIKLLAVNSDSYEHIVDALFFLELF